MGTHEDLQIAVNRTISGLIWRCPRCRGPLNETPDGSACASCAVTYERIGEILDLRLSGPSWIDHAQDRADARRFLAETAGLDLQGTIRWVFGRRPGWDDARIALRMRQVLAGPERLRTELQGWLQPVARDGQAFLECGCGGGALLAAAASLGRQGIGVDVSMVWLQVASRMIKAHGGHPVLAAAMAEALPLVDGAVNGVVSLDVIEHVNDPGPYLREIDRVSAPGGHIALATPNRFSLAAEPHVFLWGVGWLPRSLQMHYVQWRRGESYAFTRLLGPREAARLLRRFTQYDFRILVPPIAEREIAHFSMRRRALARLYNVLLSIAGMQRLLVLICPYFRIVGTRRQ